MGAEPFHAGKRTDKHDGSNSRFSQFCEDRKTFLRGDVRHLNKPAAKGIQCKLSEMCKGTVHIPRSI